MGQLPLLRSSLKECVRFVANKVAKFKEFILLPVIMLSEKQNKKFLVITKIFIFVARQDVLRKDWLFNHPVLNSSI